MSEFRIVIARVKRKSGKGHVFNVHLRQPGTDHDLKLTPYSEDEAWRFAHLLEELIGEYTTDKAHVLEVDQI